MKRLVLLVFAVLPLFMVAQNVKKVAILETVDKEGSVSYGIKLQLRANLTYAISNTPGYEGYDRVDMSQIMGEQNFQRTGMVSDAQIKKLGEMTGAGYVLIAEAASYDNSNIIITAKILNVETAGVENSAPPQIAGTAPDKMQEACTKLASMLLKTGGGLTSSFGGSKGGYTSSNSSSGTLKEQKEGNFQANMSSYTDFYNQKNYKDAYPVWKWCFDNCDDKVSEMTTKNIFIHGPTILENVIATREGDAREAAIDTLLIIYDKRIQLYGKEATYLGSKAIMLNKYRPQNYVDVYNMCARVFELAGNSTYYNVLEIYMVVALNRYNNGEISKETMRKIYSLISGALAEQLEKETKEVKKSKIAAVAKTVEKSWFWVE